MNKYEKMDKYEKLDWWFKDLTPEWLPMYWSRFYIGLVIIVGTIGSAIGLGSMIGFWGSVLVYCAIYIPAGVAGATVPEIIKENWRRDEQLL